MSTNTTKMQGRFTSTGADKFIPLRAGVTWMQTYNVTAAASPTDLDCGQAYWQFGMPARNGILYILTEDTPDTMFMSYSTTSGFTYIDTSSQAAGTINTTITAISNAAIPVVTNSGTNGLTAGNIVRIFNVAGAQQVGGMEFSVGYNTLSTTTFSLDYMAQVVAGTTGSWMKVDFDPIYYPRRRFITKISQASQAVVTLSVTHGYQVGQVIRMVVPAEYGMTQMNGIQATIVAVDTTTTSGNTITLDVDSSAFTAFAFPLSAAVPFTPAEVVPMGENTPVALDKGVDISSDATRNTAQIGMLLNGGASSPAGASGDVIYWTAGTSFSVDNQ